MNTRTDNPHVCKSVVELGIFIPIVSLMMQNTREKQSYIMTKTAKIEHKEIFG